MVGIRARFLHAAFAPAAVVLTLVATAACSATSSDEAPEPTGSPAASGAGSPEASAAPTYLPRSRRAPALLLPNMSSLPAEDVQIRITDSGQRELRFTAALANTGDGPLIVVTDNGEGCPADQRHASQAIVVDADGDATYTRGTDPPGKRRAAGCMLDHPTHEHWHFDASASYVLTRPGATEPIAATDKVSFCLRDSRRLGGARWREARETYGDCDRDSIQGITVGYADVYDTETDGQSLPLADDLPDGVYCLTLTADPHNLLRETDENDNAAAVAVRITATTASAERSPACTPPP